MCVIFHFYEVLDSFFFKLIIVWLEIKNRKTKLLRMLLFVSSIAQIHTQDSIPETKNIG
jgi:hypothetical protein